MKVCLSSTATMDDLFEKAAAEAKVLPVKPSNDVLGELYGLYKQATEGDVNIECPGILQFTAQAKWNAWNKRKGLSKEEAMTAYVELVKKLKENS